MAEIKNREEEKKTGLEIPKNYKVVERNSYWVQQIHRSRQVLGTQLLKRKLGARNDTSDNGGEREWNRRGVVLQSIQKERKSISATQINTPGVGD
jgi:hypothetical protein